MAGFLFCKNCSTVVSPLTSLLSPSKYYEWSAESQHAFDSGKTLMCI